MTKPGLKEMKRHVLFFGHAVARTREAQSMSREQLSRKSGVGLRMLERIETGAASPAGFGLDEICRIAGALRLRPCQLMERYEALLGTRKKTLRSLPYLALSLGLAAGLFLPGRTAAQNPAGGAAAKLLDAMRRDDNESLATRRWVFATGGGAELVNNLRGLGVNEIPNTSEMFAVTLLSENARGNLMELYERIIKENKSTLKPEKLFSEVVEAAKNDEPRVPFGDNKFLVLTPSISLDAGYAEGLLTKPTLASLRIPDTPENVKQLKSIAEDCLDGGNPRAPSSKTCYAAGLALAVKDNSSKGIVSIPKLPGAAYQSSVRPDAAEDAARPALKLPSVLHFCAEQCLTFTLENGQFVNYTVDYMNLPGQANEKRVLSVESFTPESVILRRTDYGSHGVTAVYSGPMEPGNNGAHGKGWSIAWGDALASPPGSHEERQAAVPQPPFAPTTPLAALLDLFLQSGDDTGEGVEDMQPGWIAPSPQQTMTGYHFAIDCFDANEVALLRARKAGDQGAPERFERGARKSWTFARRTGEQLGLTKEKMDSDFDEKNRPWGFDSMVQDEKYLQSTLANCRSLGLVYDN